MNRAHKNSDSSYVPLNDKHPAQNAFDKKLEEIPDEIKNKQTRLTTLATHAENEIKRAEKNQTELKKRIDATFFATATSDFVNNIKPCMEIFRQYQSQFNEFKNLDSVQKTSKDEKSTIGRFVDLTQKKVDALKKRLSKLITESNSIMDKEFIPKASGDQEKKLKTEMDQIKEFKKSIKGENKSSAEDHAHRS